jgi:hypothetical protein
MFRQAASLGYHIDFKQELYTMINNHNSLLDGALEMTPAEAFYLQHHCTEALKGLSKDQIIQLVNQRKIDKLYAQGKNVAKRGRLVDINYNLGSFDIYFKTPHVVVLDRNR